MVEVVSSLRPDGTLIPYDIRKGVWVCFEGDTEYLRRCFEEYKVVTDPSGRYMCSYKKWHLIGLELGVSVASVGLRQEPTGVATCFNADVVATAKRDLKPGEMLDGEGDTPYSASSPPPQTSLASGILPLGLAHSSSLSGPCRRIIADLGRCRLDDTVSAYRLRREMEAFFADKGAAAVP